MSPRIRAVALLAALAVVSAACTSSAGDTAASDAAAGNRVAEIPELIAGESFDYGPAPSVPDGELTEEVAALIDELSTSYSLGLSAITIGFDAVQLQAVVDGGDARTLWLLADLLRFPIEGRITAVDVLAAFEDLSSVELDQERPWTDATNHLIAWDLPAFPGYLDAKRALFTVIEPQWTAFFVNDADTDWRHVSWGGVLIDDRVLGNGDPCTRGCIPALDDPAVTDAAGGDWYPDDAIVFGIEIDGEARAYPKNMMEVHEMVNDTIGGRRLAIPYCTLCGSAQAWVTTDDLTMRTSGLLLRSNKMMFELGTLSMFDTFLGVGTSGPLQGEQLEQVSVATSTWGAWKQDHPDTTILAEDGGIGRPYADDPLRGRDDDGPIFPIGATDDRLPLQEPVLGLETADGTSIAVHVAIARATLQRGEAIIIDDLTIELTGDGLRAVRSDGSDAGGHQAFWFAWSQFRPDTTLWPTDY